MSSAPTFPAEILPQVAYSSEGAPPCFAGSFVGQRPVSS